MKKIFALLLVFLPILCLLLIFKIHVIELI